MKTYSLCVPTYKCPHLLEMLLKDIFQQIVLSKEVIIVDGDPHSGEIYFC